MKRLTIRNSDGSVSQPTATTIEAVFQRLAAYEDTGMTPEQIRNAQDTLQCFDNIGIKRGNEIVKAEEEGRLVVLPCKIGDTLYRICHEYRQRRPFIRTVTLGRNNLWRIAFGGEFGKTAFLTRSEAEAAMVDVTDINVGNKPVNDLYDEDGGDIYE